MQVGYLAEYLSLYSEVGTALISEVLSRWNAVDFQFFLGWESSKKYGFQLFFVFSEQNGLETAVLGSLPCRISSLGFGLIKPWEFFVGLQSSLGNRICTFFCKISTEIYLWVAWWIICLQSCSNRHEIKNMVQGAVGDSLPQNRRGTRIDLQ